MIIFLPPIIDKIIDGNYTLIDHTKLLPRSYTPNVTINRIHKSKDNNSLLIYQIESVVVTPGDNPTLTQMTTSVSSQPSQSLIKGLYRELKFEIISDIQANILLPTQLINIFGIVLDLRYKEDESYKCTTVLVSDFDISRQVTLKLWRGLAAWISSLTIGARIQARNLLFKNNELYSTSSSEIYLLAHGSINSNNCTTRVLSSRIDNLNQKERDILLFLNHQSLLIPKCVDSIHSASLSLSFPFYLQFNGNTTDNCWIFQGFDASKEIKTVRFVHFDAKIWQSFNELFIKPRDAFHFDILFNNLKPVDINTFEFLPLSSLQSNPTNTRPNNAFKTLDWNDLISAKVVLYGTFEIEAILEYNNNSFHEESLGNLSMLPDELRSQEQQLASLKCPHNPSWTAHVEHAIDCLPSNSQRKFVVNIKTVLNEGSVHEVIRKSIFIVNNNF